MPATASLLRVSADVHYSRHLKLLLKYIKINENARVGVELGTITHTWSEFTKFNLCRQYGVCLSDDRQWLRSRVSRSSPVSLMDKATAAQ